MYVCTYGVGFVYILFPRNKYVTRGLVFTGIDNFVYGWSLASGVSRHGSTRRSDEVSATYITCGLGGRRERRE